MIYTSLAPSWPGFVYSVNVVELLVLGISFYIHTVHTPHFVCYAIHSRTEFANMHMFQGALECTTFDTLVEGMKRCICIMSA